VAIQIEKSVDRSDDPAWLEERYRELLGATIGARNSTFLSNLGAWVLIAFSCLLLPNRQDFIVPLGLRLGSMMLTIVLSRKLAATLAARGRTDGLMRWIELNLAVVGLSWALLVLPILGQDLRHPAHLVVGSGAFIVVGSVMTTLSALKRPFLWFSCGFFVLKLI